MEFNRGKRQTFVQSEKKNIVRHTHTQIRTNSTCLTAFVMSDSSNGREDDVY